MTVDLRLGDCLEILPTLAAGSVDAVITDFPYGERLIAAAMPEILRVAKRALIFCGSRMLMQYPEPSAIGAVYIPNGAGRRSWGFQCAQPILYYGKDPYLATGKGARPNSFRTEQPNLEMIDHPCPKPVKWMTWAVSRASLPGETVLDPFMGSGTTGVACVKLGDRNFVGVEQVPTYFAIAQRRIAEAQAQLPLFQVGA